jgi:hypothetical protein
MTSRFSCDIAAQHRAIRRGTRFHAMRYTAAAKKGSSLRVRLSHKPKSGP